MPDPKPYSEGEKDFIKAFINDPVTGKKLLIEVQVNSMGIFIHADGYGEKTSVESASFPIMVEFYNDRLRVLTWGDINQEDPTHIIGMEGARESLRLE